MTVGYAGAEGKNTNENIDRAVTYQSVCSGDGNTEALKVRFDTTKVTIEELLDRRSTKAPSGRKAKRNTKR